MDNNADNREEDETPASDDEDIGAPVAPIIRLEEIVVSTGEEDEKPLLNLKAKLYRFDRDGNRWKERCAGSVKLLKHDVTGKVRILVRQSKTLKICANHFIGRGMSLQQHAGNEKSCVWNATDFADGELKNELFCIRFASIENCRMFLDSFQEIVQSQNNEENQNLEGSSNNEENQNSEKNQNKGENQENEKTQNHEENQNNGENQNSEKNQNNGENQNSEKSHNNGENQENEKNQNHEENQNSEKNQNKGENQEDEKNQNNDENQNHEENQNNEESQDKDKKDASAAAARLLENLSVEEHATST